MKDPVTDASNKPATASPGFQGAAPSKQNGTTTYALTDEQLYFCIIMKKMKTANPNKEKYYKQLLWNKINLFAMSEFTRMMGQFATAEDRKDVTNDLVQVFLEKLPYYNPLISTPTTFFVRYFRERIAAYIRKNKVHLSQYDAFNSRRINYEISELEKQGIPCTYSLLSERTGLSQKVIRNTMAYSYGAKFANVDDAYDLYSNTPTPEDAYCEKEKSSILCKAIMENTTEDERMLFFMRVNLDGDKMMPFEKIAAATGRSIADVKSTINSVTHRLSMDENLLSLIGTHNQYKNVTPISFQDNAAEFLEQQLEEFLRQLD